MLVRSFVKPGRVASGFRCWRQHITASATVETGLSPDLATHLTGAACLGAVQNTLKGLSPPLRHFTTSNLSLAADQLSEDKYDKLVDATLDDLYAKLEILLDEYFIEDADIELSEGVLKLALGSHGTYVVNKQAPNKQLWVSSPVSGPVRYDSHAGRWVYSRDGHDMHQRLEQELREVFREADLQLQPDVA
ncbi:hypothetical protein WJX73_003122 [Symbiochloris irregularis]|uniref:ferroxidase n=1 Tax=Symbiochloris irregularis TaxID=706552 RepID=A0AAW1P1T2_9CHLO